MANPTGKGLKPFKPGQSGNPAGSSKKQAEIRKFKEISYHDFIGKLQHFGSLPKSKLKSIVEDANTSMLDLIFARLLYEAQKGNLKAMDVLFDRMWGKPKEADPNAINVTPLRPLQNATPEQLRNILDGKLIDA